MTKAASTKVSTKASTKATAAGCDEQQPLERSSALLLPALPGIYQFLNASGKILYVGKARDLRKRVVSYFSTKSMTTKTQSLMRQARELEYTVTSNEQEALVLECNLIKKYRPRYNVLLRDDKSYPYIHISAHVYPRLTFYRGGRKQSGRYFGPFPSASAVRSTLDMLHRVFHLRSCNDSYFSQRTRPCLEYQIKRCSGPCVEKISTQDYQESMRHSMMFLEGRYDAIRTEVVRQMEQASKEQDYERAVIFRDQLTALQKVSDHRYSMKGRDNIDVVAVCQDYGISCVALNSIRNGYNMGLRKFYPRHTVDTDEAEIISAFLAQYYRQQQVPHEIVVNQLPDNAVLLASVLTKEAGHTVLIKKSVRGMRKRWLEGAEKNALLGLQQQALKKNVYQAKLKALQELFKLDQLPQRIECFDVSHTSGRETVASCVVFDGQGKRAQDYRKYGIKGVTPSDDYAALYQALERHFSRRLKMHQPLADVLLIDGGKGQLKQAIKVLEKLSIRGVCVVGIAKGAARKPGEETLFLYNRGQPCKLEPSSPVLHLVQEIRDEAHRFAITSHRRQRDSKSIGSVLESIAGIGAVRRKLLLQTFGGLQALSNASINEIKKVKGISPLLAQRIYQAIH